MAQLTVPLPDASICAGWSEQDRFIYNRLNYYLVKMQIEYKQTWQVYANLVGTKKWQQNMGPVMRSVTKEPSPINRQFFNPAPITGVTKKDVIDVRERSTDDIVYKHRWESPVMNFLPNFQDFLTDHVTFANDDISAKLQYYNDIFIRGYIFGYSPFLYVANRDGGNELQTAQQGYPTYNYDVANMQTTLTGAGKTTGYLQAILPTLGNPGNLSLNTINLATTILETDLRMPPFMGQQAKDNPAVQNMYCLICSGEAYNQFIYDPWLLNHKNIELDVVKDGFKGSLFGRVTCKLEPLPIRINADGSIPDPELRELNPAAFNAGESVPNPSYVNAPYEVAFLCSYGEGYKAIEVGAPPKDFAKGLPEGFGAMHWNGETKITKNILTQCQDANGVTQIDTNKYGEHLQIIAQATYGCSGEQKRSIFPIIFKRWRGARVSQ